MATDPEDSIIAKVGALAAWTENTNLFKGPLRSIDGVVPQTAVFVNYTGGPEPLNHSSSGVQEYEHAVQVVIRGEPEQFGSTRALAEAIYAQLHDASISGYYSVRATNSGPLYVDQDERGSYLFVVNMRLRILE